MANIRQLYEGVKILMKYEQDGDSIHAEHDQLWCGATDPDDMTTEERQAMDDNGFAWDKDYSSWFIFT